MGEITDMVESVVQSFLPVACDFQRFFASSPELAFKEKQTQSYILSILSQTGIKCAKKIGLTGIVVCIKGTKQKQSKTKCIGIRSDMDGLEIKGKNVHRCGHDIHMASVLSIALILHHLRDYWSGTVKVFFQPAEETGEGALRLLDEGILSSPKIDFLLGVHLSPGLKQGYIGLHDGPVTSSIVTFSIQVVGKETHSSTPEKGINALQVSSDLVTQLYDSIKQNSKSTEYLSFSIAGIESNSPENVVCPLATIKGSIRSFSSSLIKRSLRVIKDTCKSVQDNTKSKISCYIKGVTPSVKNDKGLVKKISSCLTFIDRDFAFLGSEDFSYYSLKVPSVMMFIGTGKSSSLHTLAFKPNRKETLRHCILSLLQSTLCLLNSRVEDD
jgi:amidohydrolase